MKPHLPCDHYFFPVATHLVTGRYLPHNVSGLQLQEGISGHRYSILVSELTDRPVFCESFYVVAEKAPCAFIGLVLNFKALCNLGPAYLSDSLLSFSLVHSRQSSEWSLLVMLALREVRGLAPRNRAFSVVVPVLWNSLPFKLRPAPSLSAFQRGLKTFLFWSPFNAL